MTFESVYDFLQLVNYNGEHCVVLGMHPVRVFGQQPGFNMIYHLRGITSGTEWSDVKETEINQP